MMTLASSRFRLLLQGLVLVALLPDGVKVLAGSASLTEEESSQPAWQLSSANQDNHHHHDHHNNIDKNHSFCHGGYNTMFVDGFRFSFSHNSTSPCLSYYVRSWKLSMSGKFRGAMVFSFLLALLTEGLAATRFLLIDYIHQPSNDNSVGAATTTTTSTNRKLVLTSIYALQSWLGTMIMLVSMMYSIELLISVVAGLMVGNFLFVRDHSRKKNQRTSTSMGGASSATTNTRNTQVARQQERQALFLSNNNNSAVEECESIGGTGVGAINGPQMPSTTGTQKEE